MTAAEAARMLQDDHEIDQTLEVVSRHLRLVPVVNHLGFTAAQAHEDHIGAINALNDIE